MTSTMAREIAEIPQAAERFLSLSADALDRTATALASLDPQVVVTVARGSSDHAATYLKYAIELVSGVPVASVGPSVVSVYGRELRLKGALCVGISQSGRSPDIVETMQAARRGGALTLAITNDAASPMAGVTDHCLPLRAGVEASVAATKTFVISVLAGLALLARWRQDAALQQAVDRSPAAFDAALMLDWSPLVDSLVPASSAYILGRGPALAIADETALKLKETCGLHAEAHSAAEVLHGPAALARVGFPALALTVQDAARDGTFRTAAQLAGQGAEVFVTGEGAGGAVRALPSVPPLHPLLDPLVLTVAVYAMAERLARMRGQDPDHPHHLQKVTETR